MASGWQSKLARVSQMNWAEIRTRLGQEFGKRADVLLYASRKRQPRISINTPISREGQFFFSLSEISDRAELIRTLLPDEQGAIIREADDICQHRFRLLGYDSLDYGGDIDWHLDRVHGKRAALLPWPQIPFLEFAAVGDHKVTWELNRHQHLVTLAKAWLLSRDDKYLHEVRAQWASWIRANPYPLGINWASTLEVAFRAHSWIWIDHLLAGSPGHDDFHAQIVPEMALHGRYIERFLSTYFSPNTHLLGEAVVLFFIATLYPQIAGSQRWSRDAWKVVLHEAKRQVRPDGVYFEQSLHYHVYALDFFLYARLLAERNGMQVPAEFDSTLNRMLDVLQAISQAGPPEGFGDDDGGRLFNPRRNRTEQMTDPLAIGRVLYQRSDLPSARLTEESIWLFGSQAVSSLSQESHGSPRSAAFRDGGIYVLTDSRLPQQLVVDAGPQGIGRCGHGHADALSVRLGINGQRWLVDPGTGVYISSDRADRNVLRGTAAHNTLRVDELDQATPADPFSWTDIPGTRVENWQAGATFSYFSGNHDGYSRLSDVVIHSRQILKIESGPILIRDVAHGQREHELELFWHFAPGIQLDRETPECVRASYASNSESRNATLRLIVPPEGAWELEISRSVISPSYGRFSVAPLLREHARLTLPAERATLLWIDGQADSAIPRLSQTREQALQAYELRESSANHLFCFALDKRPWNFGPWFSDAEFFYCRMEREQMLQLVMVGGTHISWQNQPVFKAESPSDFFEWRKQDDFVQCRPGTFHLSSLFRELTASGHVTAELDRAASSIGGEKQ